MDKDAMCHFGIYEEAMQYLQIGHIQCLFDIQGQWYMEPPLEFLSTLQVDVNNLLNEMHELIAFRVARMTVSISM